MFKFPTPEQVKFRMAVVLMICFGVLLWLPTVDSFFGFDHSPQPNENRALAKFPVFTASLDGVHDYPAGLEAHFRDHFGFRNRLIRWERRWKHDWFQESASPDVFIGRKGWLYFSGDHMVEHFQGLKLLSPEDLKNWQTLLEKRRDWLAQRGIKYVFCIPPDKQSVYPELLPEWLSGLRATNKLDQFVAHMKAHSTVEVLDLRTVLLEAKKTDCTYLRTDTHWNTYGGFVAYQTLMETLRKQLPELTPPLQLTNFDISPLSQAAGDLSKMLSEPHAAPETNAFKYTLRSTQPKLKVVDISERLPQKWRPLTEPKATLFDGAPGKAVVFRDSFAGTWYAFLGYHFHEVLYIWQYSWDAAFLEREKPAVVVDEMLERFFSNSDPAKLMEKDALP